MEPPSAQQVYDAVSCLLHPSQAQAAATWLETFQASVFAWQIADTILHENRDNAVNFVAAQTLRNKIQRSFHELPVETHSALRDSLVAHLKGFGGSTEIIRTQLALAVADLAVQMPAWAHPLPDLIGFLAGPTSTVCLLELLAVLPEELGNEQLAIKGEERHRLCEVFGLDSQGVYPFLEDCWQQVRMQDLDMVKRILKALASWVRFGGRGSLHMSSSPMLPYCFEVLFSPDEDLSEAAKNVIIAAVFLASDSDHQAELQHVLYPMIFSLEPRVDKAIAEGDSDLGQKLVLICVELGDSLVHKVAADPSPNNLSIVNLMLKCARHPDREISHLTFNFWYDCGELLHDQKDKRQIGRDQRTPEMDAIAPYYLSFIDTMSYHVRCPRDLSGRLDYKSDTYDFRERLLTLLDETRFIAGGYSIIQLLWQRCSEAQQDSWQGVEANLYLISVVASAMPAEDKEIIPQILDGLLALPETAQIQIRYTAIKLIGELAYWISCNPDTIAIVFKFLLSSIQMREVIRATAVSIKALCQACRQSLLPHFSDLLLVVQHSETFGMNETEIKEILKGISRVVSSLPMEGQVTIRIAMNSLCDPILAQAHQAISVTGNDPSIYFDRLGTVFKNVNIMVGTIGTAEHPCWDACSKAWALIRQADERFGVNKTVIEATSICLKFLMRCLVHHSLPLLGEIANEIVRMYQIHYHSSLLYSASIIVEIFGAEQTCVAGLVEMIQTLSQTTFLYLSQSADALRDHPDIVEDYFRLGTTALKKNPLMILSTEIAVPSLQFATAALLLSHKEAHDSVSEFLRCYVIAYRAREGEEDGELVKQAIVQHLMSQGELVVFNLISCVAGGLPSFMVPDVNEILWEIHSIAPEQTKEWVRRAPSLLPFPDHRVTLAEKEEFIMVFAERLDKASFMRRTQRFARRLNRYEESPAVD